MVSCSLLPVLPGLMLACNACIGSAAQLRYPFVTSLLPLFVVWLFGSHLIRFIAIQKFGQAPLGTSALWRWTWMTPLALLFGALLLIEFAIGFLVSVIWLVSLALAGLHLLRQRQQSFPSKMQWTFSSLTLVVAMVLIPVSYAQARTPRNLVSWLGRTPPHLALSSSFVIPEVIRSGRNAVEHLAAAMDLELSNGNGVGVYRVTQVAYCLAKIGGDNSLSALKSAFSRIDAEVDSDWRWQAAICLAYAEAGKAQADSNLIRMFEEAERKDDRLLQMIAICSLARTSAPVGLGFARDHSEVLQKFRGESREPTASRELAAMVQEALQKDDSEQALVVLPVYDALNVGIFEARNPL